MKKIVTNKIRCKKCGDIIESRSVHDLVTCKCGAVSADGGHEYLRCCGELEDFEDLSEYEEDLTVANAIHQFVEQSRDEYSIYENYSGRYMFGKKCLGIVVRQGNSYMEMLMKLTKYLDDNSIEDAGLQLEGVSVDELGLDTVVYFPSIME
ncbi:MAG: hypothetical protein J6D08_07220 [Lachnospiraceae bacterium]|nr:hypothetical protein [Lachnospiraceae bacterium]